MAAAAAATPTFLGAAVLAAAELGDAAATLETFDAEGYASIDTRSLYQSTLLHTAARRGHVQLARALLARGADVNSLDFGAMRRSPLHWACHGGFVSMVELLIDSGADTTVGGYADGRSWSKLVQGSRCGSLIPKNQPTESVESVCRNNAVRLALTRPAWHPGIHDMWPQRFKDAARMLLLACSCPERDAGRSAEHAGPGAAGGPLELPVGGGGRLPLSRDTLLLVLQRAAYPISAWL